MSLLLKMKFSHTLITLEDLGFPVYDLLISKDFYVTWLSNLLTLGVLDETYSINTSCAQIKISTFYIL